MTTRLRSNTTKSYLSAVPPHLAQYIARQDYRAYTPMDHASWRYIMRISRRFFKDHAHKKYLSGLIETGISTEVIPKISEMSKKLKRFNWLAVPVTGFIPPAVFLEFLSLSILPIACDIRRLEHLDYTPAPDIVHEAAGHAPIISDSQFAAYLHKFGEIARKAIFAYEDLQVYEAIKNLSEIKESSTASEADISAAEERLKAANASVTYTSEASKLSRLGWWSTEYGLTKTGSEFKIYGAGLLSSVGESYNCYAQNVPRVKLTIDCVNVNYDITKPQPQLFYIENFKKLEKVIDELADQMSYRLGGVEGLARAKRAQTVTTTEFDSGLQISGVLSRLMTSKNGELGEPWRAGTSEVFTDKARLNTFGEPIYLQWTGPVQLAWGDQELKGHSAKYHKFGYGTPLGLIKGLKKSAQSLTDADFVEHGFRHRKRGRLEFESGVVLEGVLVKRNRKLIKGKSANLVLTFSDCTVFYGDQVLYQPDWGPFDMACAVEAVSVFGGAADRRAYVHAVDGRLKTQARAQGSNLTDANRELMPSYKSVRDLRVQITNSKRATTSKARARWAKQLAENLRKITAIYERINLKFANEWLLRLELLELIQIIKSQSNGAALESDVENQIKRDLARITRANATVGTLIRRGIELLV